MFWNAVTLALATITTVQCSDKCSTLQARDITLNDLEGQWYWVLATFGMHDCEDDCSGFIGTTINETFGTYMTTGRRDYNPILTAELRDRTILIHGRDQKCCQKVFYCYRAAVIEDNFLCFYFCGPKAEHDYAQCFGRSQDITSYNHERLYHGLRYFGLIIAERSLRKVNREFCYNRPAGVEDSFILTPKACSFRRN